MEAIRDAIVIAGMSSMVLLWGFCALGAGLVLKETFGDHVEGLIERLHNWRDKG